MKKIIFIIPMFLIAAALIILSTSIKGETNDIILSDYHDSEDVEMFIDVDSIIKEALNEDIFKALNKLDFAFDELKNIDIEIDSIDCQKLENLDLHLDSIDIELDNLDIELDNLDIELDNLDIELDKLKDRLDTKKIVVVIKKDILDSLKCNMEKTKLVISDNMRIMKDSLKSGMHKLKRDLRKDIRINCLRYKDYKNMTDQEIIDSLKEDGIIENENEAEINRKDGKVIIKITKTKQQ